MTREQGEGDNALPFGDTPDLSFLDIPDDPDEWEGYPYEPVQDIDEVPPPQQVSMEDSARIVLLVVALFLFTATLLIGFGIVIWGSTSMWDRTSEFLSIVFPVETLILGAAVSYYFKSESK